MSKSVVVIGAGVAGISAAVELIENGFEDVKVLEAENRIGGRLLSVLFGTKNDVIDLGAQWVSAKNEVYYLLKDHFEFGDTELKEDRQVFLTTGEEVDQEKCRRLNCLSAKLMELTEEMKCSEESFGVFFTRKFREALKLPEFEDIDEKLANQMLHHHERQFNANYAAASWNQLPAKFFPVGDPGEEAMTWKTHGYSTLLDYITKKLPDSSKQINIVDKTFLNKKVVSVDWTSDEIIVKCEDESEFLADHVITTLPHGILKKYHGTLFNPSLPTTKIEAINALEFGAAGKVFLEFEEKLFPDDVSYYSYLWAEADLTAIRGTEKEWLSNLTGFLHVDQYPCLVEAFVAGDKMIDFETIDEHVLVDGCMWLLEKLFKKPLKRPINVKRTKWLTNQNFLGSYSFRSLSAKENTVETLAKPICNESGKPVLLFAGEATDEIFMGYVNGGMRSGIRAAKEISDCYNKN